MYTYVQRSVCKKENTAMYVHTGGVSNAYSRIRTARARVHGCGWVGMEKLRCRRVHGEATEWSCSSGGNGMHHVHREPTGLDGTAKTRPSVPQNGGTGLVFDRLRSEQRNNVVVVFMGRQRNVLGIQLLSVNRPGGPDSPSTTLKPTKIQKMAFY